MILNIRNRIVPHYPGFLSLKPIRSIATPPGLDASPSQVTPSILSPVPFIFLGGERHCKSKVSCPKTQHNDPGQDRSIQSPTR